MCVSKCTVRCLRINSSVCFLLIQLYNELFCYSPLTSSLYAVNMQPDRTKSSIVSIGDEQEAIEAKNAQETEETIWNSFKFTTDSAKLEHFTIASVAYDLRTLGKTFFN